MHRLGVGWARAAGVWDRSKYTTCEALQRKTNEKFAGFDGAMDTFSKGYECSYQRWLSQAGGASCCAGGEQPECDICDGDGTFDLTAVAGFTCFKDGARVPACSAIL